MFEDLFKSSKIHPSENEASSNDEIENNGQPDDEPNEFGYIFLKPVSNPENSPDYTP